MRKDSDKYSAFYEIENEEKKKKKIITVENAILFGTAMSIINCAFVIYRYAIALSDLNARILSNNPLYLILASVLPIVMWVFSTTTDYWNFHNRKIALFMISIINAVVVLVQPLYTLYWSFIVKNVFKIKVTAAMTQGMIIMLAQLLLVAATLGSVAIIFKFLYPIFLDDAAIKKVKSFKLKHYVDFRKYKENLYDLKIVKDIETGKDINIKEGDRFVHMLINGASGTGKTSSAYLPAICQDLEKKYQNREKRKQCLLEMLLNHEAYYTLTAPTVELEEYSVHPYKRYKRKFKKIWEKYPDCGMTIMAPNNAMNKKIVQLAAARNIDVNVLDPAKAYDESNVKNAKINPFYVPLNLSEEDRVIRISEAATVFSDVLIAVNERDSRGDQYFSDISKSTTSNIATACMLARNIQGKQTNIGEIQRCINNFALLRNYVDVIEQHFGMLVEASVVNNGKTTTAKQADKDDLKGAARSLEDKKLEGEKIKKGEENPYYQTINFIKTELLGPGSEKMFDQARGLRNLVNKILNDPRFKAILAGNNEERIDFDETLGKNQITVINTALEFGAERSTAFGLFYILMQKASVLRRPEEARTPHFVWIDELSQYMHGSLEEMFTLYRQYSVAVVFALQDLSQMERSDMTKMLKSTFLTAGTHIVFGRLSPEAMKTYSEMAGTEEVDVAQKTVSETSMLTDNPNYSTSERVTPTVKNKIEGSDMRYLDFQEVTIMSIDEGRVVDGKFGKVFFLTEDDFRRRGRKKIKYDKVKDVIDIVKESETAAQQNESETAPAEENIQPVSNIKIPEIQAHVTMSEQIIDYDRIMQKEANKRATDPKAGERASAADKITGGQNKSAVQQDSNIEDLGSLLFGAPQTTKEDLGSILFGTPQTTKENKAPDEMESEELSIEEELRRMNKGYTANAKGKGAKKVC